MKKLNINGRTIASLSRKAAIELMNEYRYLVPGNAPIPEDCYIPHPNVAVMRMLVIGSKAGGFRVSIQFLLAENGTTMVMEQELETFINDYCDLPFYYPQYFSKEFAKHVAKSFRRGMVIKLAGDGNLQRFLKYRAQSIEIISVKALSVAEAFASSPVLYAYFLPPVPDDENEFTVVVEYRYDGIDQAKQGSLLPYLFSLHDEVANIVDEHYLDFYSC